MSCSAASSECVSERPGRTPMRTRAARRRAENRIAGGDVFGASRITTCENDCRPARRSQPASLQIPHCNLAIGMLELDQFCSPHRGEHRISA